MATQTVTNINQQKLGPSQQKLFDLAVPELAHRIKKPPKLYPKSVVPDFNKLERTAQGEALTAAGGPVSSIAKHATQGVNFLTSGQALHPHSNPALAKHIQGAIRPVFTELTERALPSVRGGALASGQYGGSRQALAEAQTTERATQAALDTSSKLASEGYQSGLDAMSRALYATPTIANLNLAPSVVKSGVGAQQRALETAKLQEASSRYLAEQMTPFNIARTLAAIASGLPEGSTSGTATGPAPSTNRGTSILGGALAGAGLAQSLGFNPLGGAGLGGIIGGLG